MARPADRAEAAAATAETRRYFSDGHYTGPRLNEDTNVAGPHACFAADEKLDLLAHLVVAEVYFWKEAGLGVHCEVVVDVVGEPPANAVHRLTKALKVDARVERANLGLVLVSVGLPLRGRHTENGQN